MIRARQAAPPIWKIPNATAKATGIPVAEPSGTAAATSTTPITAVLAPSTRSTRRRNRSASRVGAAVADGVRAYVISDLLRPVGSVTPCHAQGPALHDLPGHGRVDGSHGYGEDMETEEPPRVGLLLREWRRRRKLSQLDLALRADSSTRHLSCVETGRARPSREMVLRLAEHLDVPLRDRNGLLLAAGYAPAYRESPLDSERMTMVRSAVRAMLAGHEPYPAAAIDRIWNIVDRNDAMSLLLGTVPPHLTESGANVMRLILHPEGLASQCLNFAQVRAHALGRIAAPGRHHRPP